MLGMRSLDEFAGEKLKSLEQAQLRRTPAVTTRDGIWAKRDGRRLLSFSCNDYLNLSQHPEVIAAALDATTRYGVGAGASRCFAGNVRLLRGGILAQTRRCRRAGPKLYLPRN